MKYRLCGVALLVAFTFQDVQAHLTMVTVVLILGRVLTARCLILTIMF